MESAPHVRKSLNGEVMLGSLFLSSGEKPGPRGWPAKDVLSPTAMGGSEFQIIFTSGQVQPPDSPAE